MQREDDFAKIRERRRDVVDERDSQCAGIPPGLSEVEEVRAATGLGDSQEQSVAHAQLGSIDRGNGWTHRARDQTEPRLKEVFREGRGVVRAAPGAGSGEGRWRCAKTSAEITTELRIGCQ